MALIKFRVQYRTAYGENLYLLGSIKALGKNNEEKAIPLRYINESTWGAELDIRGKLPNNITYTYFVDNKDTGLRTWEYKKRTISTSILKKPAVLLDTWSSPSTLEYTFQTKAFDQLIKAKTGRSAKPKGNIQWSIDVSMVPENHVLCISGNTQELGYWHGGKPLLMKKSGRSTWRIGADMVLPEQLEYKYAFYNMKDASIAQWEEGPNRFLSFGADDRHVLISDEGFRTDFEGIWRGAGVAVPVFSLRTRESLGVGEFEDLKSLVDWCQGTGMKLIQLLPINDSTARKTWMDSYPYAAISVFALHPIYLRLENIPFKITKAVFKDLRKEKKALNLEGNTFDYEAVFDTKIKLAQRIFKSAYKEIVENKNFNKFIDNNKKWLRGYAVFCVLRDRYGTPDFNKWSTLSVYVKKEVDAFFKDKHKDYKKVLFYCFLQYCLDDQLNKVVDYAHSRGIVLKGDLPIGVYRYSCDAWMRPDLFHMDMQAGAPPDQFAMDGQNWGFPTYNWSTMKAEGYQWWKDRFNFLEKYFDVFRIDHILGFFRIWQIPYEQTSGLLGYFEPAIGLTAEEIQGWGIPFSHQRYVEPFINDDILATTAGAVVQQVKDNYLIPVDSDGDSQYAVRPEVGNLRKLDTVLHNGEISEEVYEVLKTLLTNVLFIESKEGSTYHPRQLVYLSESFEKLPDEYKERLMSLYNHYFYEKQEEYWEREGRQKLPTLKRSTDMLICAEDLGMVPKAVPEVLEDLGILKLEVQRMPSRPGLTFSRPLEAPYLCVVTASSHDTSTLRAWWKENAEITERYYSNYLGRNGSVPNTCDADILEEILQIHLNSPAMWAIQPIQEYMGLDDEIKWPDPEDERINIPSQIPHYWRWRMHISLEDLIDRKALTKKIRSMILSSGRNT